ncbi:MAG TPA: hypothetical protein PKV71_21135 [Calditrichia bacterium]|nr:hypothetical protein [Calditrichota bacterium]HQU73154.1 hypothetical protein [Calditrichia bacterium]HQV34407.1 hypothetical protein [Calditrichia bacterium]
MSEPLTESFQTGGLRISQPVPGELILESRQRVLLLPAIFMLFFFGFWYFSLFMVVADQPGATLLEKTIGLLREQPLLIIFFAAPLVLLLPVWVRMIPKALIGETFHLDGGRGTLSKNGTLLFTFDHIRGVSTTPKGIGVGNGLYLLLGEGKSLQLAAGLDREMALRLVQVIGNITGKPVH